MPIHILQLPHFHKRLIMKKPIQPAFLQANKFLARTFILLSFLWITSISNLFSQQFITAISSIKDVIAYTNSRLKIILHAPPNKDDIIMSREKVEAFLNLLKMFLSFIIKANKNNVESSKISCTVKKVLK